MYFVNIMVVTGIGEKMLCSFCPESFISCRQHYRQ